MIPMRLGKTYANIRNARRSAGPLFNKAAVLLRWASFTQPTDPRQQPSRNDTQIPIDGRFYNVSAKDVLDSNGYFVAGDVLSNTEIEILGTSNEAGAIQQPDRLLFEGFTYQVVGKPERVTGAGGLLFTKTLWRKI